MRLIAASAAPAARLAREAEFPAVAGMLHDFNREFGDPAPAPEWLAARIGELVESGSTEVLVIGEPPCGFGLLRYRPALLSSADECYLAELYVRPERRGGGLGRALLRAVIGTARARGCDFIDLNTAETDLAARALYESMGFSRTEGRPDGPVNFYYERSL